MNPRAPSTDPAANGHAIEPEWLDRPDLSAHDRRRGLSDLRRVNRLLFGRRPVVVAVLEALRGATGRQWMLDVAAGSGDVGAAAARGARRRGLALEVVALDRELAHLVLGRQWGEVGAAVVASADALPFRAASFDLALSSLLFHHLDRAAKASVSAEMVRVSRRAAVIVDLVRNRWATIALRAFFPLVGIGKVAREDGLVSLERSWTVAEWRGFLAGAAEPRRRFPARVSIVLRPSAGGPPR